MAHPSDRNRENTQNDCDMAALVHRGLPFDAMFCLYSYCSVAASCLVNGVLSTAGKSDRDTSTAVLVSSSTPLLGSNRLTTVDCEPEELNLHIAKL